MRKGIGGDVFEEEISLTPINEYLLKCYTQFYNTFLMVTMKMIIKKKHRENPQKIKTKKNPTKNQDFDLYRLKPSSSSLFIKISEVCSKETVFALLYASFSH